MSQSNLSRRQFLKWSAMSSGALALSACVVQPVTMPEGDMGDDAPAMEDAGGGHSDDMMADVEVVAGDVLDYTLDSDEWAGPFGSVTFQMHEAMHNGESAYFIRTDASDQAYADAESLVYVPLLAVAAAMSNTNKLYTFSDDRAPVISMIPGDENYSSLFKMMSVEVSDSSLELTSEEAVMAAMESGDVTVDEEQNLFVNYPLIKWSTGGLSVDPELEGILANGQLFEEADTSAMTVTMKLHQCYPGSRYIVTDSGMMAPMMNISDAPVTNELKDLGGTDEIWVFGNGLPGPGVMGFQPAIFDHKAGDPAWSPFWDHSNSDEIRELVASGERNEFNGVPDSHPTGFVVNCPAPILAPNTYEG